MSAPKLHHDDLFVGRYKVLRELGRGGMGTVHLAYQLDLERNVALKRILPENIGLTSAEGWFKREYKALAAIHHPGIPAIHDRGRSDDSISYFTMEMIDGPSLRKALDTRRLDALEAITIAIDLAGILAAAHHVGIVHRDVKPSNVILDAGGRVRLIDFGICYFLPRFKARPVLRSVGDESFRTGPMEVVGTVGYSDPALMNGHPPSVQSDIFSVCAVLYEMLAQRRFYDERANGFHPIDTAEFAPELMPVVAELRRGCALLPRDRHASMAELIRSLEIARFAVTRAQDRRAQDDPRSMRRFFLGWTIASATALALVGFYWLARHLDGAAREPQTQQAAAVAVVERPANVEHPAEVERPAEVELADEAERPPTEVPAATPETRARPVAKPRTPPAELTQAQVVKAARDHDDALRNCLQKPRALNLEVMVDAGRGELTRVEWAPYKPGDTVQSCLFRAIAAINFPLARSAGEYRLKIGD